MNCRATSVRGAEFVCDGIVKDEQGTVFLNALSENMPECDRKRSMSTLDRLDSFKTPPHCRVYCAQRSCDAAKTFLKEHDDALSKKCASVTYLPGGALEMDQHDLVDGVACHRNIVAHNIEDKGLQEGCLTCSGEKRTSIDMTIDGTVVDATYLKTNDEIPEWYRRSGIVGNLPTQFSCDKRYKGTPVVHDHKGSSKVKMDISKTDLPGNSILAYWGAKPSKTVRVAEQAYGTFNNSGIVQCKDSVCEFPIDPPSRYTEEGKVYKSHIHVTEWLGDRWNLNAKTIDIE